MSQIAYPTNHQYFLNQHRWPWNEQSIPQHRAGRQLVYRWLWIIVFQVTLNVWVWVPTPTGWLLAILPASFLSLTFALDSSSKLGKVTKAKYYRYTKRRESFTRVRVSTPEIDDFFEQIPWTTGFNFVITTTLSHTGLYYIHISRHFISRFRSHRENKIKANETDFTAFEKSNFYVLISYIFNLTMHHTTLPSDRKREIFYHSFGTRIFV